MEILVGIILVIGAIFTGFMMSPILVMAGAMSAADDPNSTWQMKVLGAVVIVIAIVIPVAMFITGVAYII